MTDTPVMLWNAFEPIVGAVARLILIRVMLEQDLNALAPILLTVLGIFKVPVKPVQLLNAKVPII